MWYHGTTQEHWELIKTEGVLWGIREIPGFNPSRCTYLASTKEEANQYGDIILEVSFDPSEHVSNWIEDCWQVRVYTPIPFNKLCLI